MSLDQWLTRPAPALHPWETGTFDARPGLTKLGADHVFTIDETYARALANKRRIRGEGVLHRHYLTAALSPEVRRIALVRLAERLSSEWSEIFTWTGTQLTNRALGWTGRFDLASGGLELTERFEAPLSHLSDVTPIDAFDFLASNVGEDLSLWQRNPDTGADWLPLVHVCAPHFWDPRDKVGRPFSAVHAPVYDVKPTVAVAPKLARAAVEQGPYLRFAWGPATNDRMDHHLEADHEGDRDDPVEIGPAMFERLYLRVERQTLFGLPEASAALFTIRPYWYRLVDVVSESARRGQLARALAAMSDEALRYKNFAAVRGPLLAWLEQD